MSELKILSEHGCNLGEFYLEEIAVDSAFRRKGVGSSLLSKIPQNNLEAVVVDMPKEFSKNWVRMSKTVWNH